MRKSHQSSPNDKTAFRKYKRKIFQKKGCTQGRMCLYGRYAPARKKRQAIDKSSETASWGVKTKY